MNLANLHILVLLEVQFLNHPIVSRCNLEPRVSNLEFEEESIGFRYLNIRFVTSNLADFIPFFNACSWLDEPLYYLHFFDPCGVVISYSREPEFLYRCDEPSPGSDSRKGRMTAHGLDVWRYLLNAYWWHGLRL